MSDSKEESPSEGMVKAVRLAVLIVVAALVTSLVALEVFASRSFSDLELSGGLASDLWR